MRSLALWNILGIPSVGEPRARVSEVQGLPGTPGTYGTCRVQAVQRKLTYLLAAQDFVSYRVLLNMQLG